MRQRDQFKLDEHRVALDNLTELFRGSTKRPLIGVTQGGSSRKAKGAKVAATDGLFRPKKPKRRKT